MRSGRQEGGTDLAPRVAGRCVSLGPAPHRGPCTTPAAPRHPFSPASQGRAGRSRSSPALPPPPRPHRLRLAVAAGPRTMATPAAGPAGAAAGAAASPSTPWGLPRPPPALPAGLTRRVSWHPTRPRELLRCPSPPRPESSRHPPRAEGSPLRPEDFWAK